MIDYKTKIITDEGNTSILQLILNYSKLKPKNFRIETYYAEPDTTLWYHKHLGGYWITLNKQIKVKNEYNEWTNLKGIHYNGHQAHSFEVFFDYDKVESMANRWVTFKCTHNQNILSPDGQWKEIKDLKIGKDYARVYNDAAYYSKYMGIRLNNLAVNYVTLALEKGTAFQIPPGMVVHCGVNV